MKSYRKFRFGYTKGDRNGIFLFCLILVGGVSLNYLLLTPPDVNKDTNEQSLVIDSIQQLVDSLKKQQRLEQGPKIYPFNPNFIDDYKGYTLNMSTAEIDRLLNYRAKDKWINSKSQFQEVTQVSDQWMMTYGTYFKFPDWVVEQQKSKNANMSNALTYADKKDLNQVNAEELMKISGIGSVLANRIIAYRNQLGGFVDTIQLKDVYGLSNDVIENLNKHIVLKTPVEVEKKNINTVTVLELTEIPYFDYEISRSIFNFIRLREGISDFKELSKIEEFPSYKLDRIQLYLKIIE